MKKNLFFGLMALALIVSMLACATGAPKTAEPVEVDTQATVDAAVAATAQAQAEFASAVDAAVQATATAAPQPVEATPVAQGEPVEYVTMTEEELEALIDEAVAEAVTATEECTTATTQASSDQSISQEEAAYVYDYYYAADEAIYYALDLIEAYYGIYGDLAYEYLYLLEEIEDDLEMMASATQDIVTVLEEVSDEIEAGLVLAEDSIAQINAAAEQAQANVDEAKAKAVEWQTGVQADRDARAQAISDMIPQPDQVPEDRLDTLLGTFEYVDTVKSALMDGQVSRAELDSIAQLSTNLSAGFESFSGPQLQDFSGKVNEITMQLALGQVPTAHGNVLDFESALGERPAAAGPGIELPQPSLRNK